MVSVLTFIFEHFEILITGMTRTSYSKLMEIDNITLTKMKYVLNKNGACVSRDQIGVHAEEVHDEEEKWRVSSDEKFEATFESPLPTSLPEEASTSTWTSRMKNRLTHLETYVRHLRDTQSHMLDTQWQMANDLKTSKAWWIIYSLAFHHPKLCTKSIYVMS